MLDIPKQIDRKMKIEQRPGQVFSSTAPFNWSTSTAQDAGLNEDQLETARQLSQENASDSLLILRNGRLVSETYWNDKTQADLQQTFSGTKSVFSLIVGRCIEHGYLSGLDHVVRDIVPEMPEAHAQLTFRNIMAMESGLKNSPEIESMGSTGKTQLQIAFGREVEAAPFERYHYNNAPYRLLFTALERVSGLSLEELTAKEVFEPLGFDGACWVRIYAIGGNEERFTGYQSIRMRPRDFAKSVQVITDDGMWQGENYLPAEYTRQLVRSPAPHVNPSFGLFHHLNAGDFYRDFAIPVKLDRKLVPGAPEDLFLMTGAGGQNTAAIPSLGIVVVRTGGGRSSIYAADNYFSRLLRIIADSVIMGSE